MKIAGDSLLSLSERFMYLILKIKTLLFWEENIGTALHYTKLTILGIKKDDEANDAGTCGYVAKNHAFHDRYRPINSMVFVIIYFPRSSVGNLTCPRKGDLLEDVYIYI